ncbi:hypothetical protein VNO77_31668 [Canavalia gladiata]|uniref:Uncharacterized protein n=1 Tax=Canavalia gladiata TaxID=3824 RepID=A0AAN9KSZ2_CANGL
MSSTQFPNMTPEIVPETLSLRFLVMLQTFGSHHCCSVINVVNSSSFMARHIIVFHLACFYIAMIRPLATVAAFCARSNNALLTRFLTTKALVVIFWLYSYAIRQPNGDVIAMTET